MKTVALTALLLLPSLATADGGAIRCAETRENYRITVFTAPTPVRAGAADISVLVQNAGTEAPVADVQVSVKTMPHGFDGAASFQPATKEAATNKLYYAAAVDLPAPGWHTIEVAVAGPLGEAQVRFDLEAAEPLPAWPTMWPWVAWPSGAIVLFGVHQYLVRSKRHGSASRGP